MHLCIACAGTAVTRTGVAQFMISAGSQLPGVGISGIRQTLSLAADGGITTTNEAVFGFGPLGSWAIGIDGAWQNTGAAAQLLAELALPGACFRQS